MTEEIRAKISTLATTGVPFFFIVDFHGNAELYSPEEARNEGILFSFNGQGNTITNPGREVLKTNTAIPLIAHPIDYSSYLLSFNKARNALKRGDTYLINITFRTEIETVYSLKEIFQESIAPYKLLYKDKFVIFSPESFIRISNGVIMTKPMKGTINTDVPQAEALLINNEKEYFEHNTIVDLLRNDLNMVSSDVKVERFRYLEKIKTHRGELLQASSLITGKLPFDYKKHLGSIVGTLLPAGSVTGAPKERTVSIIKEIESYDRGYYTGVFGFYDGETLDVAVSIRFIEKEGDRLFYKSGGGITYLSNPADEYNEMLEKVYLPF